MAPGPGFYLSWAWFTNSSFCFEKKAKCKFEQKYQYFDQTPGLGSLNRLCVLFHLKSLVSFDDLNRNQLEVGVGLGHQTMVQQPCSVDELERLESNGIHYCCLDFDLQSCVERISSRVLWSWTNHVYHCNEHVAVINRTVQSLNFRLFSVTFLRNYFINYELIMTKILDNRSTERVFKNHGCCTEKTNRWFKSKPLSHVSQTVLCYWLSSIEHL